MFTKDDFSQTDLKLSELRSGLNNIISVCYHHNEYNTKKCTKQQKMLQSI